MVRLLFHVLGHKQEPDGPPPPDGSGLEAIPFRPQEGVSASGGILESRELIPSKAASVKETRIERLLSGLAGPANKGAAAPLP